jgi:hypothetical protein
MATLQEKYLSKFDFASPHSILINAPVDKIYPIVRDLKFKNPALAYWLMKLRSMSPPTHFSIQHLKDSRFVVLEEIPDKEIIIGLIGQPWTLSGNLQIFQPQDFIKFNDPAHVKASWSFELTPISSSKTELRTETRIACPTPKIKRRFGAYWFFIKPFSGLIRKAMLRAIKSELERSNVS